MVGTEKNRSMQAFFHLPLRFFTKIVFFLQPQTAATKKIVLQIDKGFILIYLPYIHDLFFYNSRNVLNVLSSSFFVYTEQTAVSCRENSSSFGIKPEFSREKPFQNSHCFFKWFAYFDPKDRKEG